jgi:hypothetical protein
MSVLIYAQGIAPVLPLAPRKDPVGRAFGWDAMTAQADSEAALETASTRFPTWLGADRYQEASELAFHDPRHPATFSVNLAGRVNQYELWPRFADVAAKGDNLLLVLDETREPHSAVVALSPYFARAARGGLITLRRGRGVIGTRRIWLLSGWKGGWPEQ